MLLTVLIAFMALVVVAARIRSWIMGDYRDPPAPRVEPAWPREPDHIVDAMKADLRRQFAAEEAQDY